MDTHYTPLWCCDATRSSCRCGDNLSSMSTSQEQIPAGSRVAIKGLVSKPALNGQVGIVLGPEHSTAAAAGYAKGRIPVRLLSNGSSSGAPPLLVKPESLELATQDSAAYNKLCSDASELFEERKSASAIQKFKEAITLEPDSFAAYFQLGMVYEADYDELPGALELASQQYVKAAELSAPDSAAPDFVGWTSSFVRAANLLTSMPAAAKPVWWSANGLKQRCGLVLNNPQGFTCHFSLVSPAWRVMACAFLMENNADEAAECFEKAASYEMDGDKCRALLAQAAEYSSKAAATLC